jgi:chromosome segregation protein
MGARFVRLGISGFKSFADPTSIEILPGLTGIVGPNGCGKSNVAEAFRWAMGEANARSLRGGEMDDVIFAGAANRPSRNLAEVALTLEDDDAGLPPPFSGHAELHVVRRIERGAGSAYRVNGKEARARDVQTLFADLASGARSSAMVSQGRVSALVGARPEDRRAVLEEAAGITGLHARRAEAETRLRAAEANLERAEERRVLLDRQLAGLQVQAKQAERYRKVATDAVDAEAGLLALQRARARHAVAEAEQSLNDARAAVQRQAAAAAAAETGRDRLHAALPGLRDAEATARTRLERARLAQESIAAEAARAEAALLAARQRQAQLRKDLVHAESILHDAERADAGLAAESAALQAAAIDYPSLIAAAQAEAEIAAAALRQADEIAGLATAQAAEASTRTAAMQRLLDEAQARARRAEALQQRLVADRQQALAAAVDPARLASAEALLDSAAKAASDAQLAQHAAEAERTRTAPLAAAARDAQARAEAARHKISAQVAALAEVLAVRDNERWPPMVDRLVVPPGLEAALGAALGEELAAAANPDAPRHWRQLPAIAAAALPGQPLSEVVTAPGLLERALSAVSLVGSDAEGDQGQQALQPGQSLVSAAGGLWRWDGYTVRAGAPTPAAIRLQQRNRLVALQEQRAGADRDAAETRADRDAADQAERAAATAEQQCRTARRDAEAAADRARTALQSLRLQADAAAGRLAALDDQAASHAPEAAAAAAGLDAARQEHAALPNPAELRAAADAARAAVAAARARDAAASRALDGLRRAEHAGQSRIAVIAREREDRRMRAADLGGRVTDLAARAAEADSDERRLAAQPAEAALEAAAQRQIAAEAELAHRAAIAVREAAEREASAAAAAAREAEHAVFAARETIARAEGAQEAAIQMEAAIEARAAEREDALPAAPPPADLSAAAEERARARLARLVRERDEIGPVNLRAEIEAKAIADDIATIIREREELGTAIAKLRGSVGHLNREGRERLTAVFQQVDRHFQTLFGRMFGGGRAHLAMVGSDDPLLAGLEIFAQPPGKKLASLNLLSGGEQALTALSLIFAIFLCNPAPLCVLDEVDAPLDDANVERFCALLSDMAGETGTRFLVVTHHQLTMSRMDRLYGVTMQERGVSRLLSVDLSRAVVMLDAAAAE